MDGRAISYGEAGVGNAGGRRGRLQLQLLQVLVLERLLLLLLLTCGLVVRWSHCLVTIPTYAKDTVSIHGVLGILTRFSTSGLGHGVGCCSMGLRHGAGCCSTGLRHGGDCCSTGFGHGVGRSSTGLGHGGVCCSMALRHCVDCCSMAHQGCVVRVLLLLACVKGMVLGITNGVRILAACLSQPVNEPAGQK